MTGHVLEALSRAGGRGETRLSRVALDCNMPYDRFKDVVDELQGRGVVDAGNVFALTPTGRDLLHRYKSWSEGLKLFGLGDEE